MSDDKEGKTMSKGAGVYAAIGQVMATLAKDGISKDRRNEQQGYKFRGIDDVYNALAPALIAANLIVIPKCESRECVERITKKETVLFYVTVKATFMMVCTTDGSQVEAGPFFGEAMDAGDKATNKAMSAAYKYWAMQTFAIPTEGDNDADATTQAEVQPRPNTAKQVAVDALDSMSPEQQDFIRSHARELEKLHAVRGDAPAYIEAQRFDTEEKLALWAVLPSNVRSWIKDAQKIAAMNQTAKAMAAKSAQA